ncbi:lipopolysaccharide biosynthesis protein [Bacteroidia bacterium]|nr:lipopolysaccharide biosynthesis protein [Bacteroidia bacterium]
MNRNDLSTIKWSYVQQFASQLLGFGISIVLARLLSPTDFGLMGMIYIIFSISTVIIDSGLSISLMRMKNPAESDYSTVFLANLLIASGIYLLVYILAPYVSSFYQEEILTNLIRYLGLSMIIVATTSIYKVRFTKLLRFKTLTIITTFSTILGSTIGVYSALTGQGVWSIVYMQLTIVTVASISYFISSKWHPKFEFSISNLRKHLSFGYKLLIVQLMDTFFGNFYNIVIGKYFSTHVLGFFTRANTFNKTIVMGISSPLKQVLLPILSNYKDDQSKLTEIYEVVLYSVIIVMSPVLLYSAFFSETIFIFLFTDKWIEAAPFFSVICISFIFYPLNTFVYNFLNLKGKSNTVLKVDIIKKIVLVSSVVIALIYGDIFYLMYTMFITGLVDLFINLYLISRLFKIRIINQVIVLFRIVITPLLAVVITYFLSVSYQFIEFSITDRLILSLGIFLSLFLVGIRLINFEMITSYINTFKRYKSI